ncbi:BTB/POZ and TAZ domain-containing protein 4 [Morus notabilis]|uniref:BTB/POZ and TAZ domain-containing protein 4 n=1 Tax=Morus notabilis TaxID=981085 RepID=W9RUQ4_9ROSA|nr:BTB/POZ and TAZ domain-containing protein 4 isoform X1 [Morus notabilis]EXB94057.1 BTB/POZ and TAZ domain-containing protein 4 [Morus notabilis]
MKMESVFWGSDDLVTEKIPLPPPPPSGASTGYCKRSVTNRSSYCVPTAMKDSWDRLFDEGYRADVFIQTENGGIIYAHSSILGMASPVMRDMLKQSRKRGHQQSISILGVPYDAVQVFVRFLYSSCFEKEDMEEFALHLLVLSHVYVVPHLKQECERRLEDGLLTTENVVDIFQLALLCDAARLSVLCQRIIVNNYKSISATEGWTVMKESHPVLESQLRRFVTDANSRQKERIKKRNERMIYLQLCEAMEALVHICRDGCRTIGPNDKDLKPNQDPCIFAACKGLESLVRHLAGCKSRVPGGCIHCKRMWQLLELHSRLCADSNACGVPLCRNFKQRSRKQCKKEETKWTILVKNILRANAISGRPFFSWAIDYFFMTD